MEYIYMIESIKTDKNFIDINNEQVQSCRVVKSRHQGKKGVNFLNFNTK